MRSHPRPIRLLLATTAAAGVSVITVNAWSASAAPGADESTFVPVVPARILDTRDPTNLGLAGPFVSAVSQDLQVTGTIPTTSGTRLVVPAGATGVSLNVTVVAPSARGFLSIRPADAPGLPTTSNLNFEGGAVTPNSVTVQVPTAGADAGRIEITFDAYGQSGPITDVLVDVVGYTTRAGLADLQQQLDALASRVTAMPTSPQVQQLQNQLNQLENRVDTLPPATEITNITNEIVEIREIIETLDTDDIEAAIAELEAILDSIPDGSDLTDVVFDGDAAGGGLSGNYPNPGIAANAVGTPQLQNGAVTGAKIAPGTIGGTTLVDNSITTAKLGDLSVTTGKLADGSVTTPKLANDAVTTAKVLDGTISTNDLANNAATSAKIADGTIATADLADASVTAAKLAPGAITRSELGVLFVDQQVDFPNVTVAGGQCTPFVDVPVAGAVTGAVTMPYFSRPATALPAPYHVEGAASTSDGTGRMRACNVGSGTTTSPDLFVQALVLNP